MLMTKLLQGIELTTNVMKRAAVQLCVTEMSRVPGGVSQSETAKAAPVVTVQQQFPARYVRLGLHLV